MQWCTWWCRHVGLDRVVWVMVVVRSWCYACQVLFLQNGIDHEDEGPRFPYKPWKHPRPRSYNKVLSSATTLWVYNICLNTIFLIQDWSVRFTSKIVITAAVVLLRNSMLPVRWNHLYVILCPILKTYKSIKMLNDNINFFIVIINCPVFWVFTSKLASLQWSF